MSKSRKKQLSQRNRVGEAGRVKKAGPVTPPMSSWTGQSISNTAQSVAILEKERTTTSPGLAANTRPEPAAAVPNREVPWGTFGFLITLSTGLLLIPFIFQDSLVSGDGNSASLLVVFLTGLTTGGLSCMAVQGGLLAATIAQREEIIMQGKAKDTGNALPIVAFIGAKLVAYLLLGALLGLVGSTLSLSPTFQAFLNLFAGLFMLATAFNLLNLHPIFRYAIIQPPRSAMRLLRRYSKNEALFSPILLGFLTIFIPCGTTVAMEALAISSGSPLMGSLIMGAFVLGTSPLFFVLGYFATRLGAALHARFLKVAALAIIVLAVISINGALNLLDAPVTLNTIGAAIFNGNDNPDQNPLTLPAPALASSSNASTAGTASGAGPTNIGGQERQDIKINVLNAAYQPNNIQVKSGLPIRLTLVTNKTVGCTRSIFFRSLNIQKVLPVTGQTVIDIPAQKPGALRYVCGMGMYTGTISII